MIICDVGPLWGHLSTHRGPKRPFLGPTRSLEGPGGPRRATGGLIWSQLPQAGPTGWVTPISCALAPYQTSSALLGPPKGPNFGQKGPFGSPRIPRRAPFGVPFLFCWNIGKWGVQSVATECPAHTALIQPMWNHPAGENS